MGLRLPPLSMNREAPSNIAANLYFSSTSYFPTCPPSTLPQIDIPACRQAPPQCGPRLLNLGDIPAPPGSRTTPSRIIGSFHPIIAALQSKDFWPVRPPPCPSFLHREIPPNCPPAQPSPAKSGACAAVAFSLVGEMGATGPAVAPPPVLLHCHRDPRGCPTGHQPAQVSARMPVQPLGLFGVSPSQSSFTCLSTWRCQ